VYTNVTVIIITRRNKIHHKYQDSQSRINRDYRACQQRKSCHRLGRGDNHRPWIW